MDINNKNSIKKIIQNKTNFLFQAVKDNGKIYATVSTVAGFISDVLQPLAPLAEYIFYIFVLISFLTLLVYFIVGSIKEKIASFLLLSLTVLFVSGGIFGMQSITKSEKGILSDSIPAIASLQSSLGIIEKGIADIKQDTTEIKKSTKEISSKLDILGEKVGKQGGIISNPSIPEEYYSNARHYELKGDFINARKAYLKYFTYKKNYIDPHLNYAQTLKVQEGREGAKEIYVGISNMYPSIAVDTVNVLLMSRKERITALKKLHKKHPKYTPILYFLSQEYSQSKVGEQSLAAKRQEKTYLKNFLVQVSKGNFLKYYVDKNIAVKQVEDAKIRLKRIETFEITSSLNDPIEIGFMPTYVFSKISMYIGIKEPVKKFTYATEINGTYKEIPAEGVHEFPIKNFNQQVNLFFKYVNLQDEEEGPFYVAFYPGFIRSFNNRKSYFESKNKISNFLSKKYNWVQVDNQTLTFPWLMQNTHVIKKIRYGLDNKIPDTEFKFKRIKYNPNQMYMVQILHEVKLKYTPKFISIQLEFDDGSRSDIKIHR